MACLLNVKKWNRQSRLAGCLLLLLLLLSDFSYIFLGGKSERGHYYPSTRYNATSDPSPVRLRTSQQQNNESRIKKACQIPQLDPYDKSIEHLVRVPTPPKNCQAKYKLLFRSTLDSRIIPEKGPDHFRKEGWLSCCYRTVERNMKASKPDNKPMLSFKCFPLSFTNPTSIPEAHEFIAIFCTKNGTKGLVPVDVHAFVPKPKPISKEEKAMTNNEEGKLNVVILGLDALSRMNFLRAMPLTYSYLKDELGGVDMAGYNKLGMTSFDNLIPFLASKFISELASSPCLKRSNDDCPLIWKRFAGKGYSTFFSDDHHNFNYFSKGFHAQPTDGYPHALTLWANDNIGTHRATEYWGCWGPRSTDQVLLDYMEKVMYRMRESNRSFFHFTWITHLTHDAQAFARLGDPVIAKSLRWMKQSGYLEDTVFILMSDHGIRVASFRETFQGQLEDRMPLMFFVFPDSFKKKYGRAYRNLVGNEDKLMTVFDVHETLLDILDPENIEQAHLERREDEVASNVSSLPRGLSLFLLIPESRTCQMAGIELQFCSCMNMRPVSLQNPILFKAASAAVSHINSVILKTYPQCSPLRLHNLTLAQQVGWTTKQLRQTFTINFITQPGGGAFEAMLIGLQNGKEEQWTVKGNIERTNLYGNQSRCVEARAAKPFCYCAN